MKIAIIRLSALGDIVHSTVVLQIIKKYYPEAIIDWFTETSMATVLNDHPHINTIHTLSLKNVLKAKRILPLIKTVITLLQLKPYDRIIDMQGLIKSAIITRIIGKNSHGYNRKSVREEISTFFYKTTSNISYEENSIIRNCMLCADALQIPFCIDDVFNKGPSLYYHNTNGFEFDGLIASDRLNIAFVIGSSWPSKNYPKEKFVELANMIDANILILWGNKEEKKKAIWIASQCSNATVLPGLSFNSLKALIDKVDLTIGNDSGPTHIAWAMNSPSIVLFGPTPVERMFETKKNLALKSSSAINHYKLNKNDWSIAEIEADAIAKMAEKLLKRPLSNS